MVLRLCPLRSHNLLPTFGTFLLLELGYYCEKRGWKSLKTKKFFFCSNTTCFYSVQCMGILSSDERETDEEDDLSSSQHTMCSTCEVLQRSNWKLEPKYSTPMDYIFSNLQLVISHVFITITFVYCHLWIYEFCSVFPEFVIPSSMYYNI